MIYYSFPADILVYVKKSHILERNLMAKIIKIASTATTPQTSNLFRNSRNLATNPFKYQNFEGNALDIATFADVFEGTEIKKAGKLKMIASSVAGSMHKMKTSMVEPIANFVNRIGGSITSAWDYAKNTNVSDLPPVKAVSDFMNTPICLPEIKWLNIGELKSKITSRIDMINSDIADIGKTIMARFNTHKISPDMSVKQLEELWKSEIACVVEGVA